jgi:hypothetical protein
VQIAVELAERVRFGKSCKGIFVGDFGEGDGSFDETGDALAGKVGGGGAGSVMGVS